MTRNKISKRALMARITRALAKDNEKVITLRNRTEGAYACVDLTRNTIESYHQSLTELGEQLGVIQPYEECDD